MIPAGSSRSLTARRASIPGSRSTWSSVLCSSRPTSTTTSLQRAATILGLLAHAWNHAAGSEPAPLPAAIAEPWEQVGRRLGRPYAYLSYLDLIVTNWRLRDPGGQRTLENLRLLVPTVDTPEEHVFYLVQVEILDQTAGLVGAVVRAQEAVADHDVEQLEAELVTLRETLLGVANGSLLKIDPNRRSRSHVEPVTWAKTVAPLAVPERVGALPGPSGTTSPVVHLLDAFFERRAFESFLGREGLHIRLTHPRSWRDLVEAVHATSVRTAIAPSASPRLLGLYHAALDAYAGRDGFLGRHRLKVYGYLEPAFKVGRSVTIGGFAGLFADRAWEEVDDQLERSRAERQQGGGTPLQQARVRSVAPAGEDGGALVEVVLDVAGTGVRYLPGDRCSVLAENDPALVERTLVALDAGGDERIALDATWQQAVVLRGHPAGTTTLGLRTLLAQGQLRPVERRVAKLLLRLTFDERLRRIVEARAEDQWELWDLLELLRERRFRTRRLVEAGPGEPEHLGKVVPPMLPRTYSIASAMPDPQATGADELRLVIAPLEYDTPDSPVSRPAHRAGTASHGFTRALEIGSTLPMTVVRPPRFGLPPDPATPVVLFAGGSGVAPFLGFLEQRARAADAGPTWLLYGVRTPADVPRRALLESLVRGGRLQLRVACSRADATLAWDGTALQVVPAARGHVDGLLEDPSTALALWELITGAHHPLPPAALYVCGRTDFARTVQHGVRALFTRVGPADAAAAEEALRQMVADGRYLQEVFTTYGGPAFAARHHIAPSELADRNDLDHGHWFAIRGRVYDISGFLDLHAGGALILQGYAGTDATAAYERVEHHQNSEVDALLGMYELGTLRRFDFGMHWGVAAGPRGLHLVTLAELYGAWVRALYLVTQMQNAMRADDSIQGHATTSCEAPAERTPWKVRLAIEAHERFLQSYLGGLCTQTLPDLWRLTTGITASHHPVDALDHAFRATRTTRAGHAAARLSRRLDDDLTHGHLPAVVAAVDAVRVQDHEFLAAMKQLLRDGVALFEQHETRTLEHGETLVETLLQLPTVLADLNARLVAAVGRVGVEPTTKGL